jgi:hypothetical protein
MPHDFSSSGGVMHERTMTPEPDLVQSLELTVRRIPQRPRRWAWDLKDGRDGSWFESMWEFDSEDRARRSGLSRMLELARSVHGDDTTNDIVIVARHDDQLYAMLAAAFGGNGRVTVVRDRRRFSTRLGRRDLERRSTDVGMAIRRRGWAIACRSDAQSGGRLDEAA